MARIAKQDGYAFERVGLLPGDDTEVRREIHVGQLVPDHYRVDSADVEEVDGPPTVGLGAAPHNYKHQLGADGQVRDEHQGGGDFAEANAKAGDTSVGSRGGSRRAAARKSEDAE